MIYFHIPFCKQKCSYCNFHFSTSFKSKDELLYSLIKEIDLRKDELSSIDFKTIYFGGGTPSLLSIDELNRILDNVFKYFPYHDNMEITLEANPDDLQESYLKRLSTTPINRLSVGIQSFYNPDLILMNRAHTSEQADRSIKQAQDFGFDNISIDLIYGSPSSSKTEWIRNLEKAIHLNIKHISSYALTVEPKTALSSWVINGKISEPDESIQNEDFFYMVDFLTNNNFEHYEISNFALKGFESQHNTSYWKGNPYLGIGPSAHSYDGKFIRSWNVSNNIKYIKSIQDEKLPIEREILSEADRFNEALMIGLRTKWGFNLNDIEREYSRQIQEHLKISMVSKIQNNLLTIEENYLKIPKENWFLADGIASDLFIV